MDFVFWIIVIVLIVGVVWWLLNRSNTSKAKGAAPERVEGGLARGSSAASAEAAATTGIPGAAGFGKAAEPVPPTTADDARERSSEAARPEPHAGRDADSGAALRATSASDASTRQGTTPSESADQGEWETQWSEAAGPAPAATHRPPAQEHTSAAATRLPEAPRSEEEQKPPAGYAHHPEYTGPHSPTLPGAETAAAEAGDDAGQSAAAMAPAAGAATDAATPTRSETTTDTRADRELPADAPETETLDRARSSAVVETGASHTAEPAAAASVHEPAAAPAAQQPTAEPVAQEPAAEPAGHLAADQPYGAGSASPAPDGSGPADFPVKGDAGAMVYYEEGHPDYEQTRAEVWFESAAHAEAAGFRAPRRKRL